MNSQSTAVNVAIRHSYVSVRSQRPQSHRIHGNFSAVIRSHAAVSPQSSRKATTQQEPLTKRIVLIGQVSSPRLARSDALAANAAATFARATRPCDTEEFPVSILPRREMPRQGTELCAQTRACHQSIPSAEDRSSGLHLAAGPIALERGRSQVASDAAADPTALHAILRREATPPVATIVADPAASRGCTRFLAIRELHAT